MRCWALPESTPFDEVKKRYRALASDSHPDRLRARGVPEEFLTIANDRMAALNDAFATIEKARAAA
jgi:DnaJ like chaperone protein